MKRIGVAALLLVVGLGTLLGIKLRAQGQAAKGAAGGSAEIEGTRVELSSRLGARIERIYVRKGDAVKKGDRLMTLDCRDAHAAVTEAEARLRSTEAQARAAELASGAARGNRLVATSAKAAAEAQAAALAAQTEAARRQSQRLEKLASDVALASRDQTRSNASALEQQWLAMQAQAAASRDQIQSAGASWRASTAQAQAAQEAARAASAVVERARLLEAECEIRSPRDARVAELPRDEGELVSAGAVVVQLIDLSETRATFYLPNAELAAVHPGAEVVAVADAYPGERFAGRVATVAFEAEFTPRNIQTRSDRDRLVYPVEVVLANTGGKLRDGMPVEIKVVGTERR